MKHLNVVILAAGKGERMLSRKPKVMHEIMGKPIIGYVVERAKELSPSCITVVTGFGRDQVENYLKNYKVKFSVQTEQKGTAHALLTAEKFLKGGDTLVLYGDVPLLGASTLNDFLLFSSKSRSIAFLTTRIDNPEGYGRVKMYKDNIREIVEDADATPQEKKIDEINTGICFIPHERFPLLKKIAPNNKKGEYYLTDICKVARSKGIKVKGFHHSKPTEVLGINSKKELLEANMVMRERILDAHLKKGVILLDTDIYIESDVLIGKDTTIFPNSCLLGYTEIGENAAIGPNTVIKNSKIGSNVRIDGFAYIDGTSIREDTYIGPFERIGPETILRHSKGRKKHS